MHNFKPGDLAMIISDTRPERLGKVVELIELVRPWKGYDLPVASPNPKRKTARNASGKTVWVVVGDVEATFKDGTLVKGYCQKSPSKLMPLRGEPDQLPAKKEERPVCAM